MVAVPLALFFLFVGPAQSPGPTVRDGECSCSVVFPLAAIDLSPVGAAGRGESCLAVLLVRETVTRPVGGTGPHCSSNNSSTCIYLLPVGPVTVTLLCAREKYRGCGR